MRLRDLLRRAGIPLLGLALGLFGARQAQAGFSVGWTGPNGDDNRGAAWGDFNNDCKPDFVFVNNQPGSCVRVYRNNGNNTFTLMYTSTEQDRCTAVAVADYDGDGYIDFAVSNYSGIPCRVYHNDGNFNFHVAWSQPYGEYTTWVDWGDYDNDGRPDLVFNSLSASGLRFFHNNGNGTFSDAGLVTTPGNASSAKFGDYNKDGFLDVFEGVTGYGSVIWKGNGTALPSLVFTTPWNNNGDSDWNDFDGDGNLDLLAVGYYVNVFRNTGNNTFSQYWSAGSSQYGKACDYDADGLSDYVMSEWAPTNFTVVHNNGGGVFVTIAGPSSTGGPVAWADYDGDGGPDILGGNFQGTSYPCVVYHNDGTGFSPTPCNPGTPTRTATATLTATRTPTQTATWTGTATPTFTDTPTASITPTDSFTATPTATWTATSSPTSLPTWTMTTVPTATPTASPSFTDTSTPSATPTPSMTASATRTWTVSPTRTATPVVEWARVGLPYPNPVKEGNKVYFNYSVAGPSRVNCGVFTVAFRKIWEKSFRTDADGTFVWDLKDFQGAPVANGCYYIRVEISGQDSIKKILKLLVIR